MSSGQLAEHRFQHTLSLSTPQHFRYHLCVYSQLPKIWLCESHQYLWGWGPEKSGDSQSFLNTQ